MTSTTTHGDTELARLPVVKIQDVLLARFIAREEGARIGFTAQALTQIATAVSEITRNIVQHAASAGQIRLFEVRDGGRVGLRIAVDDSGSGIADVDRALTGMSSGAGIPGCRKLMDEFGIRSSVGAGTTVTMVKWLSQA
jgi:serine/threonine-protein kinase RsbT